jgi:alkanesulfonate monooxygenase SsuD/methylene tetrahydromethanopterin reductase-like flavin-dependent oxidoreductase (luciferase family)
MARPIKETPVLKGRDARRFAAKIANPVPISKEEREKAEKLFEALKKRANFPV